MAKAFPKEMSLSDDQLICGICKKSLTNPKLLPCLHSFCGTCLTEKFAASDSNFSCPMCERAITVNTYNVEELPDNFLFHIIANQRAALANNESECIPCQVEKKTTKATHSCLDCFDTFCGECKRSHIYPSMTRNHRVVDIKDIQAGKYMDEIKQKQVKFCSQHSKDDKKIELDFYCVDCQYLVCQKCVILEHKSHNCSTLDDFDDQLRSTLNLKIQVLDERSHKEEMFSQYLGSREEALGEEKEDIKKKIHEGAAELHDLVDKLTEEKLESVKNHFADEIKSIQERKRKNELIERQNNAVKSFTKSMLQYTSKADLVSHYKDVESRVKECMDREGDFIIVSKRIKIEKRPCNEARDVIKDTIWKLCITEHATNENGQEVFLQSKPCEPGEIFYNEGEVTEKNWECGKCMLSNKTENSRCISCDYLKPGSNPPAIGFTNHTGFKVAASGESKLRKIETTNSESSTTSSVFNDASSSSSRFLPYGFKAPGSTDGSTPVLPKSGFSFKPPSNPFNAVESGGQHGSASRKIRKGVRKLKISNNI